MTAPRPEPPPGPSASYRCPECKIEVDESADSHDEDCSTAEHCYHAVRTNDNDDWDFDDDWCVHCDCCCTCLGCEYGPRDGMPMHPAGLAEVADADA